MRKIIYYVASTIDGYIAGPGDNIEDFTGDSKGVQQYLDDLKEFDTVIMGRRTYEFGYKFGLQPGQPAYGHMKHFIFSNSLRFENAHENVQVLPPDIDFIKKLRSGEGTDIYLCGGGEFAGWLLDHKQIDILKIKLNPVVLGSGIKLFGSSTAKVKTELVEWQRFDKGLQIITYKLQY